MKPLTERLATVEDAGFAGLAWLAKVRIEQLEAQNQSLRFLLKMQEDPGIIYRVGIEKNQQEGESK